LQPSIIINDAYGRSGDRPGAYKETRFTEFKKQQFYSEASSAYLQEAGDFKDMYQLKSVAAVGSSRGGTRNSSKQVKA
jgi:hypothetical protein